MIEHFGQFVNDLHECIAGDSNKVDSKIDFGTVVRVDPLLIRIDSSKIELPSEHFYLTDNVIVKKVRFLVHRVYGQPREMQFTGSANEVSNHFNAMLFNLMGDSTAFNLSFSAPVGTSGGVVNPPPNTQNYGIAGIDFSRWLTMQNGSFSLTIPNISGGKVMGALNTALHASGDVVFRLDIMEGVGKEPLLNSPKQPQTTAIEGVLHGGLKIDDIVMMTSHNHGQKYLIHRVVNRHRENGFDRMKQYEMGYLWDSRVNDIEGIDNYER